MALILFILMSFIAQPSGGGAPSGAAGGDLAGTYPDPTVPGALTVDVDWGANADIGAKGIVLRNAADLDTLLALNDFSATYPVAAQLIIDVTQKVKAIQFALASMPPLRPNV